MIIDLIIAAVVGILGPVFSVLPQHTIAASFDGFSSVHSVATSLGTKAGGWDAVVPVVPVLTLVHVVSVTVVPAVLLYLVINWGYRHIPQIGGFGPGSG